MAKDCGCPGVGCDMEPMASTGNRAAEFGGDIAAQALYLLGLIERHGWLVTPDDPDYGGTGWFVCGEACSPNGHAAPTLVEALTAAANCNRCCGRET